MGHDGEGNRKENSYSEACGATKRERWYYIVNR